MFWRMGEMKNGRLLKKENEITDLDEAKKTINDLQEKVRKQSLQFLSWHRKFRIQEETISRVTREKNDQLKALSAKLLIFEANLLRKQQDLNIILSQRDSIIMKQQQAIETLQNRLMEAGLDAKDAYDTNDSDSAVIMEEEDYTYQRPTDHLMLPTTDMNTSDSYCRAFHRRSNSFLRRPDVLETVYSVEEVDTEDSLPTTPDRHQSSKLNYRKLERGDVIEESEDEEKSKETPKEQVVTYNRVMSNNHRSVTKPKDVKYRRINKAKSKSLEELRGRLKNWVEKSNRFSFSSDH